MKKIFVLFVLLFSLAVNAQTKQKSKSNNVKNTTSKIEFDGAYISTGKTFVYLEPQKVIYGRFGRCVGGIRDFDLCNTYFLENLNGLISVNSGVNKLIISGNQFVNDLGNYRLSYLRNFSADFGMCVWNNETDTSYSFAGDKAVYTPKFTANDLKNFDTLNIRTKSISTNKAEILLVQPLKKNENYVLYNIKNKNYFIFSIK